MNFWKGLWRGIVSVSKRVLSVFGPALQSFVAQQAAEVFQDAVAVVLRAENRGGSGREKFDWALAEMKTRLGQRASEIPTRAIRLAIELAVAQITPPPAEPSTEPTN
jgi:hypothetical protein